MEEIFDYVKRGYNPDQVTEYINTLEKVIKTYKEKETMIVNAMVSAQSAADSIVKNAEIKSEQIEADTLLKLDTILATLDYQKDSILAFQEEYTALVQKYLRPFSGEEISALMAKIDDLQEFISVIKDNGASDTNKSNNL